MPAAAGEGGTTMPASAIHTFTDADAYAAAVRHSDVELAVTARGAFGARLTQVALHDVFMQRFSETLPRVVHSGATVARVGITFRTGPGAGLRWNNVELAPDSVARLSEGYEAYQRSSGVVAFGAISLPISRMLAVAAALGVRGEARPGPHLSLRPRPAALARLRHLHEQAGDLASTAPEVIANPDTARGLEAALVEAMVACLDAPEPAEDTTAQRRHEKIMRRFHAAIATHEGDALYMPDLCAAIGVPQRTLNSCCHESLGMSPKRYLLLRRMHLARQTLRNATPGRTTVTDTAARFGFWNFGRFAVEYRALFGEKPSETLRMAG